MSDVRTEAPEARYSYGGAEFGFGGVGAGTSLAGEFLGGAMTKRVRGEKIAGGIGLLSSNAP